MTFLVVGAGSIGRRHIQNLSYLGVDVAVADTNADTLTRVGMEFDVKTYHSATEAYGKEKIDATVICTPTTSHIPYAQQAVEHGSHVFVEKPLSYSLDGVEELIDAMNYNDLVLLTACNLRFYSGMQLAKTLLDQGMIGTVVSIVSEFGWYLPFWHPNTDYRKSYSAQKDEGGIILDAIHEIDYLQWLFGKVESVLCNAGKRSDLKIVEEDVADILLIFSDGVQASVHLDYLQWKYSRSCKFIGEKGVIVWDYANDVVKVRSGGLEDWRVFRISPETKSEMYVDELRHFINCVEGKEKSINSGVEALKIALAAKDSAESRGVTKP